MMAIACPAIPQPDGIVSGMIGFLDCQAANLGAGGYQALAAPGSSAALVLTALLTIFVAVIGYRMVFGETPSVRESVLSFVKIGIVFAFATSWLAYRTMVYDVVLRAPADLVAEIGRPTGLPGASGGLADRLDGVDRSFRVLAIYGIGVPTREQVAASGGVAPPLFAGFDAFALGGARILFLIGSIGAFALVRLGAGLLLALGPLFIAFLLFDGTRGLFEGWLRALIGLALGSVAIAVVLGIELALLEPWLADLAARRSFGGAVPGVSAPLFAVATVFTVVLAGMLTVMARVGAGLRLGFAAARHDSEGTATSGLERRQKASNPVRRSAAAEGRSRAMVIADSIAATQQREERSYSANQVQAATMVTAGGGPGVAPAARSAPLGQSFRRRTTRRVSVGASARDRGA